MAVTSWRNATQGWRQRRRRPPRPGPAGGTHPRVLLRRHPRRLCRVGPAPRV